MHFPQFRRYNDGKTYFKILDASTFIEHKKIGNVFTISEIECKLYPEKMYLNDLIICGFEHVEKIDELIYENEIKGWEKELKQI
jgi:hypothetical protein